ncbi:MAG TPA: hypothetical protein VK489_02325 [Ferruginibacter sp.]|nr:hypothetical protein [Ferruginibacter sp.]
MKFLISLVLIALLSFAACLYLPWWSIAIVAFIVAAVIPQRPGRTFLAGFIALFLLWGGLSLWISSSNDHVLAHKISLLVLKMDNPNLLIFLTAFIGALVAGLAALTGSYLRKTRA